MSLFAELKWRGLLHDAIPGTEEFLNKGPATGYVGFDPTADSLGIGNLVPVMLLSHFQRHGHHPIALVGGATGRIGDPSGKSEERKLLSAEEIDYNIDCQRRQLEHFLDFDTPVNPARIVNNYDWFRNWNLLDFLREVGKHFSVSQMLSKDSVKNRLANGISFTEFSYQLIQGYDFLHLAQHYNCRVQFGGSDQFGNIVAGTDLIHTVLGHDSPAYAFTCPLLMKADGTKFGKSAGKNVWLSAAKTPAFEFYQFWVKSADEDIMRLSKTFSFKGEEELNGLWAEHEQARHKHVLQYALAAEMTERVHGADALKRCRYASETLFSADMMDRLRAMPDAEVNEILYDAPRGQISRSSLEAGMGLLDFLCTAGVTTSKGEARRAVTADKSISLNSVKCTEPERQVTTADLVDGRFLLVGVGKQKKFLIFPA